MTTKMRALICAAAAAAVIAPMIASTQAEAKRGGSYHYSERFDTRYPEHGYQGFVGAGKYKAYCSYRREPKRRCFITRSGRERCKVFGWTLIQNCY